MHPCLKKTQKCWGNGTMGGLTDSLGVRTLASCQSAASLTTTCLLPLWVSTRSPDLSPWALCHLCPDGYFSFSCITSIFTFPQDRLRNKITLKKEILYCASKIRDWQVDEGPSKLIRKNEVMDSTFLSENTHACFVFFFNIFLTLIYYRETESMSREGAERERETQNLKRAPGWAVSTDPDAGLKPTNHEIMTWAEVGRSTD